MGISLLPYVATFSGQLYFRRSYFFTLLQCNYFDTAVTFSEQLFLQSICFFLTSSFFRTVDSSQQFFFSFQKSYFFRAKLLPNSYHLRIGSSLGNLLVGTATFLAKELFRIKILLLFIIIYLFTVDIYREATFSKQALLHNINYFRRATFWKKANFSEKQDSALPTFFWRATFLEQLLFRDFFFFYLLSSMTATFSEEVLFYNILFRKSCYFTATLPFRSYTCYLSVSN